MSTFSGLIDEYEHISVDSFKPKVKYYFISHYHSDHVKGIDDAIFEDEFVYCSEETKLLILADKTNIKIHQNLYSLPLNEKIQIQISSPNGFKSYDFDVTLIQAGHCIGSVMFLFEGGNGRVLYTGDFRFKVGDTCRVKSLHCAENPKSIDSLYLDTTFFNPVANIIPSREKCTNAILKAVKNWLNKSSEHVVRISTNTRFSFDYLIEQLRLKFGMKIHVTHKQRDQYQYFPHLQSNLTVYPNETRIHNCWAQSFHSHTHLPCSYVTKTFHPPQVLTILPTTLYFQERYSYQQLITQIEPHLIRACYNHHSSYSELIDMIRYLRPRRVVPCVVSFGDDNMDTVQKRIDELLISLHEEIKEIPKPFGCLKSPKRYRSLTYIREMHDNDSQNQLPFPSSSGAFLRKLINLSPNAKLSPPNKRTRLSQDLSSAVDIHFSLGDADGSVGSEDNEDNDGDVRDLNYLLDIDSKCVRGSHQLDHSIDQSTTSEERTESSISLSVSQDELQKSTEICLAINENHSSQETASLSPSMLTIDKSNFILTFTSPPIIHANVITVPTDDGRRTSNLLDDLISLSSGDDEIIDLTQSSDTDSSS